MKFLSLALLIARIIAVILGSINRKPSRIMNLRMKRTKWWPREDCVWAGPKSSLLETVQQKNTEKTRLISIVSKLIVFVFVLFG